ncbi:MAG TPA: helix-turn-helix domain-containing protein [Inquilinus sp.]|nr:helix-turn-helix domain-containing protein [Inquilinus sp.]
MAGVRQFDEGEMLAGALEVFWRKGMRATTMADLAQATRVQRGSLYNAYGGKEDIFLLAFDDYVARFLASAAEALAAPDPEDGLKALFAFAIASMTGGTPARGCLSTRTAMEAALDDPRVQGRLRGMLDELHRIVAAALSAAPDRLAVAPEQAADLVVTFTRGLAVMERVYQDAAHLQRIAAALVRALLPAPRP